MTKFVAGIDPGLSGAIALIGQGTVIVHDMPTYEIKTNGKIRRQLDLHGLARFFDLYGRDIASACVEEPSAQPKDGPVQAFKFGFNCGVAQAFVVAQSIPIRLVRPNAWKAAMGLTSDKDESRKLASHIMPAFAHLWPLKKHDGRAEAALLAIYGSRNGKAA